MKGFMARAATGSPLRQLAVFLMALTPVATVAADDNKPKWTLGAQLGGDLVDSLEEDAEIASLYGRRRLPAPEWFTRWTPEGTRLHFDVTFSHFDNEFDSNEQLALGPIAVWRSPESPWRVSAGLQPTLINDENLAGRDMGGPFQVTIHLATGFDLGKRAFLELQWRHVSNAELYDKNDGIDVQVLSLGWRF